MTTPPPDLSIPTLGMHTRAWVFGEPASSGEAPTHPLILVHGFRGDHHGLRDIAAALAATRPGVRAIVPDLPGFGATPPVPGRDHTLELYGEWLRVFAKAVAPEGCTILGHSFGSLVVSAAIAGGLDPERAVLINPIAAPALEGPKALLTQLAIGYYRAAEILPERAARRLLGDPLVVRLMSEVMAKTGDRQLRSWIHAQHASYFSSFSDASTLLQAFRASVSHTVTEHASAFTMPTLLIAGERDDITPLSHQLALRHRMPQAKLRIIPDTGHLVHYEAVSDTVAFVAEFFAGERAAT